MSGLPASVLFACDRNSVRSPFAEGLMKRLHGGRVRVQSAGVEAGVPVDPFMVAVAAEMGVDLSAHSGHSLAGLAASGDAPGGYGLVVALSAGAEARLRECGAPVEFWPVPDPVGVGASRLQRLEAYRDTRDRIAAALRARFGGV